MSGVSEELPSNVLRFHRDHLDAAWGFARPNDAWKAHQDCQVGVCATLTAAVIRLRR